jgi:hypothetical protein
MRPRPGTALCALAITAILSGCGGGSAPARRPPSADPPAAAKELDPCTMATAPELAALLTEPAGSPEPGSTMLSNYCTWWNQRRDRYLMLQLPTAGATGTPGRGWTRELFGAYCAGEDKRSVNGVGDAACFSIGKDSAWLSVLKGSFACSLDLEFVSAKDMPAEDGVLSSLRTFATAVVARQ